MDEGRLHSRRSKEARLRRAGAGVVAAERREIWAGVEVEAAES